MESALRSLPDLRGRLFFPISLGSASESDSESKFVMSSIGTCRRCLLTFPLTGPFGKVGGGVGSARGDHLVSHYSGVGSLHV